MAEATSKQASKQQMEHRTEEEQDTMAAAQTLDPLFRVQAYETATCPSAAMRALYNRHGPSFDLHVYNQAINHSLGSATTSTPKKNPP